MSTTFGVKIKKPCECGGGWKEEIIEVAFRSNGIRFINDLAQLLPNATTVIPLDNTPQGIFTIGDIKKQIFKQSGI